MYIGATVAVAGLGFLFPILFFTDLLFLLHKGTRFIIMGNILGFDISYFIAITLTIFTWLAFVVIAYLTTIKWLMYPLQGIPLIHGITLYIYPRDILRCVDTELKIRIYRSMYIFMTISNEVYSIVFISFKGVDTVTVAIGFALCLINGISILSSVLLLFSFVLLLGLNFILIFAKSIFESSNKFISFCQKNSNGNANLAFKKNSQFTQAMSLVCWVSVLH